MPLLRRRKTARQQALAALAKAERARSASPVATGLAALGKVRRRPSGATVDQVDVPTGTGVAAWCLEPRRAPVRV
jgi:hypothetical protein